MPKLTFDEALERINDERCISRADVQARALERFIWVAEWHLPGCLSESQSYCLTKADAIEAACSMAENENGAPWGMKTQLSKYGRFDSQSPMFGRCINTVSRVRLADLL
jgi:hypothetical protein